MLLRRVAPIFTHAIIGTLVVRNMRRTTRTLGGTSSSEGNIGKLQSGVTLQDRYLILGILGSGGMSSVYKGRDLHFPNVTKLVAVKEMINMAADAIHTTTTTQHQLSITYKMVCLDTEIKPLKTITYVAGPVATNSNRR